MPPVREIQAPQAVGASSGDTSTQFQSWASRTSMLQQRAEEGLGTPAALSEYGPPGAPESKRRSPRSMVRTAAHIANKSQEGNRQYTSATTTRQTCTTTWVRARWCSIFSSFRCNGGCRRTVRRTSCVRQKANRSVKKLNLTWIFHKRPVRYLSTRIFASAFSSCDCSPFSCPFKSYDKARGAAGFVPRQDEEFINLCRICYETYAYPTHIERTASVRTSMATAWAWQRTAAMTLSTRLSMIPERRAMMLQRRKPRSVRVNQCYKNRRCIS